MACWDAGKWESLAVFLTTYSGNKRLDVVCSSECVLYGGKVQPSPATSWSECDVTATTSQRQHRCSVSKAFPDQAPTVTVSSLKMGYCLRFLYQLTGAMGLGRTSIHLLATSNPSCRMTRMKATSKSASTARPGPLESAATSKKKSSKKPSTGKQPSSKPSANKEKNANLIDDVHQEIIKILQGRRHQLKAKIKFLREQDALMQKTRPRGRTPTTSGPPHLDRRLDVLAAHHVTGDAPLDQDHLKNISDFRIQSEDMLRQPQKTPTNPQKSSTPAKKRKEEIDRVEKCKLDASQRELTLMDLNSSLKSYIIACTQTDMVGSALNTTAFYREKFSQPGDKKKILSVEVYNLIMNIFAKKGKICQVKEIFQLMKTENVKPDTRSFALALETVARIQPVDVKMARSIAKQMQDRNIPLNDIFLQCSFTLDERERILDAIHSFRPNFQPAIPYYDAAYHPPVLHSLNASNTSVLKDTPYRGVINYEQLLTAFKEQLQHEKKGVITMKSVEAVAATDAKVLANREKLEGMKKEWARSLRSAYDRNFEVIKQQFRQQRGVSIYPYLCALNREECVEALMEEIIRLAQGSEGYSPTTLILYMQMGNKMMNRYLIKCKEKYQLIDKLEKTYTEYLKYFGDKQLVSKYNCRQYWQKIEHDMKFGVRTDLADHIWPRSVVVRVGKFLYDMIINEIKLDTTILRAVTTNQFAPAVYKVYRHYGEKLKEEVKPHPVLAKLYRGSMQDTLTFDANMCPTVVPPHPWLSSKAGGYVVQNTVLYRVPETGSLGGNFVVDKVPSRQLYPILDALNQLGASPWMVNQSMLDLIIEVFRNKGMPDVDIPQPVSECPPLPKIKREMSPEERSEAYRQRFLLKKKRNEMFSLWCDALYKLSIANHFRDKVFWFPQNIDFRGRVYPVPPHFQHLGGDMARSMLLFAKGMPLGENGLDWLKIHLINLTGLKKKQSLPERRQYANEIMEDIFDSADNPFTGRQWWKQSDDPWQTLACCKEIAKASRNPAGPAAFVSHFPIHQDGSCNGLQHYAALGRDQKGAEAVNLYPFETPQDVYSGVAALVEKDRKTDAANDVEIAQVLDGFVSRKVVKQTVMTIVYGVTRYGAKAQIQGQLADLKEFPSNKTWPAAAYLAGKTFDSIGQMFTATRRIQDWFVDCARLVSTVREKPVEWVTPLGLPVLQPYFKHSSSDQSRSKMHLVVDSGKPNTMKQKNAFPPNFIHSLDSSHMMLTCLHCAREGISFAAVHDSYWTHPVNVDIMNKHCRQQFVALHSLPILDDLSAHLTTRFAYDKSEYVPVSTDDPRAELNRVLRNVPPKGTFNLESVLKSTFFFS